MYSLVELETVGYVLLKMDSSGTILGTSQINFTSKYDVIRETKKNGFMLLNEKATDIFDTINKKVIAKGDCINEIFDLFPEAFV